MVTIFRKDLTLKGQKEFRLERRTVGELKKIEEAVFREIQQDKDNLVREKSIISLIQKIESELVQVEEFTQQVLRLEGLLSSIQSPTGKTRFERATQTVKNLDDQRAIAQKISGMDSFIRDRIDRLRQEVGYVERIIFQLKKIKIGEEVETKHINKWIKKARGALDKAENIVK